MKHLCILFATCFCLTSFAQKNIFPVTQSSLTGIQLPAGSTQDKRLGSVYSAKFLLQIESLKQGVELRAMEVFYLPPVSTSKFGEDSILLQFSNQGWSLTPVEGDNKYVWLQKENRYLMAYFEMDKKKNRPTQLYFGEAASAPPF